MMRFKGIAVSEGFVRGEALLVGTNLVRVRERRIQKEEVEHELQRLDRALSATRRDITDEKEKERHRLGELSEIFSTHLAVLSDETSLILPIRNLIQNDLFDAPTAVARRFREVAGDLQSLPEPMPSRIPDLVEIERRVIGHLLGRRAGMRLDRLPRKVVILADDLTPSQTASLDREKVLAFATDRGGPASHTAILARHLGIPAIVGLGSIMHSARPGDQVIVDGLSGEVIVDPDEETIRRFQARTRRLTVRTRSIHLDVAPLRTADDHEIEIQGNVDRGEEARGLRDRGIRGIGLFRTEYLYLGREDAPDEHVQAEHYARLLADMAPHPVCIRTMDFGADKWDHRVGGGREPNPFLGMRAIRLSFAHEHVFGAQLRAILRASAAGNARVMFPMITDLHEFRRAKGVLEAVKDDLRREGIPFDPSIKVGAMIEVPSAALTADSLLTEADFVSLGSNDLTQYTLAVDRTNPLVASYFNVHHPAVIKLIQMAASAANNSGKKISACGEMAGSSRYCVVLLGLGIRTLSMTSTRVAEVAARIRGVTLSECIALAQEILVAPDAVASRQILDAFLAKHPLRPPRR